MPRSPAPETPEAWDAASVGYADKIAPTLMQPFADELTVRLGVDSDSEVLEVGAGSGALTQALAPRVRSLLATDFSPKMVELLRARMQGAGAGNVRCELMDGQSLDLDDAGFDAAASSFALMLFPDRAKGFSELRRVLRPGGRAVVSGWTGPDQFEAFGLFLKAARAAFPFFPAPRTPPPVFSLADPAQFKAEMEAAGFSDVQVDIVSREMELAGADDVWELLTTGAPAMQALFAKIGTGGRDRIQSSLGRVIEKEFGNGPIHLTNAATVGVGVAR